MTYPPELSAALAALGRAGVELALHPSDPTCLRHRPATLAPDLASAVQTYVGAILVILAGGYVPEGDAAAYVLDERLGIADGLGMPTHPGSAAWVLAVGESIDCSCREATPLVDCSHGSIDEGDSGGNSGERGNPIRDRQGRGRGP